MPAYAGAFDPAALNGERRRYNRRTVRWLVTSAAVIAGYVAAAAIGFELAFVAEQITTVWAPTGIALAALLLDRSAPTAWGPRLWPAIWIGALLANAGSSAPFWTAVVIATGNTLEAVVAVRWLRSRRDFRIEFHRIGDVLAFLVIAGIVSTAISATIGVAALCAAGTQSWDRFARLWFDWWLGDALGALVVAPAILGFATHAWSKREAVRAVVWVAAALVVTHIVFGQRFGPGPHPIEYVVFPIAIGAAVAGGPALTSWVVLAASVVAIADTVHGAGPFASTDVHYSLVLLQAFLGVLAGTSLVLSAAIAERVGVQRLERKATESLRHRQDMLRLAQRAGGVATFEWDFGNQVAQCSAEFFEIFGLPAEDGVMTAEDWGRFVHPDDRARMAAHLARALAGSEPAAADYRITAADGSVRWLSYSGQIRRTADGDRMLGTVANITARKRAEIALAEAKAAAESANELKDEFLATLSHELRTPLNAILGYARMLRTDSIPPPKRMQALEIIERNAVAQNQLVDDLLDMSRITTGKVRLDPQPVPVVTILREAVEGVRPAADARGVALEIDLDPFAGTVRADTTRLQQVFWNVLTNAVKFSRAGGRIAVSLRRAGEQVEIVVADTGIGIAADFLPFVFEPFRQADSGFDRAYGGLGLGLAITRQLVELHGGSIRAASDGADRGATFTICLPRVRDAG